MDHETVEEIKRHFGVVVEDLRSDNRALAEGQVGIRREIGALREEVTRESEETRAVVRLSHSELDRRVRSLETEGR